LPGVPAFGAIALPERPLSEFFRTLVLVPTALLLAITTTVLAASGRIATLLQDPTFRVTIPVYRMPFGGISLSSSVVDFVLQNLVFFRFAFVSPQDPFL
jgi:hypothetical protein